MLRRRVAVEVVKRRQNAVRRCQRTAESDFRLPRPFVDLHDPVVLDQHRRFGGTPVERVEAFFEAEHGEVQR